MAAKTPVFVPVGNVKKVTWHEATVELQCQRGKVRVQWLGDAIVRVRATPTSKFRDEASWAVVEQEWPAVELAVAESAKSLKISTAKLSVEIEKKPCQVVFRDAAGHLLSGDLPGAQGGMGFVADKALVKLSLTEDEHIIGLGEKCGPLNKRGRKYEMWNTDNLPHTPSMDPLYQSWPIYLGMRDQSAAGGTRCYARMFDDPRRMVLDCGNSDAQVLQVEVKGGAPEVNYYFLAGPTPGEVLERIGKLTGRMPLPPMWALGHQQCRYSYFPEKKVREIVQGFRERKLPNDVIYLDIDYMDGYRVFTWDKKRFPNPKKMISDFRKLGTRTIVIIDPGVKNDAKYKVNQEGLKRGLFLQDAKGKPYKGHVWPGETHFPDFLNSETRQWWGQSHRGLIEAGIAGIWDDMNEPSVFGVPSKTFPEDSVHTVDGKKVLHRDVHNVYGMQMARATYEGLKMLRPEERPFVLTRSAYLGAQRYTSAWMGDNSSWWEHLWQAMPMLLSVSMAGMPFVGVDIGGFMDHCTGQLYARWMQMGVFLPLCRTHTCNGTRDQEPWSFGEEVESICRRYLEMRYQMLPHTYTLFYEAATRSTPIMRPLAYHYPEDARVYEISDQYLWGESLLVAPIFKEHTTQRMVYLPKGLWRDYWTGDGYEGGRTWVVDAPLEKLPLFVKAGAILPTGPVLQHTEEKPMTELTLNVCVGGSGEYQLYEDDGKSMLHENGMCALTAMSYRESGEVGKLVIETRQGMYEPHPRKITVRWFGLDAKPEGVMVDGKDVAVKFNASEGTVTASYKDDGQRHEVVWRR